MSTTLVNLLVSFCFFSILLVYTYILCVHIFNKLTSSLTSFLTNFLKNLSAKLGAGWFCKWMITVVTDECDSHQLQLLRWGTKFHTLEDIYFRGFTFGGHVRWWSPSRCATRPVSQMVGDQLTLSSTWGEALCCGSAERSNPVFCWDTPDKYTKGIS